jgi:hypothetical protein
MKAGHPMMRIALPATCPPALTSLTCGGRYVDDPCRDLDALLRACAGPYAGMV